MQSEGVEEELADGPSRPSKRPAAAPGGCGQARSRRRTGLAHRGRWFLPALTPYPGQMRARGVGRALRGHRTATTAASPRPYCSTVNASITIESSRPCIRSPPHPWSRGYPPRRVAHFDWGVCALTAPPVPSVRPCLDGTDPASISSGHPIDEMLASPLAVDLTNGTLD